jgi:hypothetical protein
MRPSAEEGLYLNLSLSLVFYLVKPSLQILWQHIHQQINPPIIPTGSSLTKQDAIMAAPHTAKEMIKGAIIPIPIIAAMVGKEIKSPPAIRNQNRSRL